MNSSAIAARAPDALVSTAGTAASLRAQINLIQQVMRDVMIEDVHFGKIPGTPKPSLYKPGAEVLCAVFHIAPLYRTEDLSQGETIRYRVTCLGRHQQSGIDLGEGVGECSSDEGKYKWRAPICDPEFEETPIDRRREKWSRGNQGPFKSKQIRTEPADIANTVLKMGAKRAQIAMVLNVLAASDLFSQDLEDLPEGVLGNDAPRRAARSQARPRSASGGKPGTINESMQKLLRVKLNDAGMSADDLCKRFEVDSITKLPFDRMNDALAYIADPERDAIQREADSKASDAK
jgi:hypothetical protein